MRLKRFVPIALFALLALTCGALAQQSARSATDRTAWWYSNAWLGCLSLAISK
jgi:hypothetical protein